MLPHQSLINVPRASALSPPTGGDDDAKAVPASLSTIFWRKPVFNSDPHMSKPSSLAVQCGLSLLSGLRTCFQD